jgi:hypothetical protein
MQRMHGWIGRRDRHPVEIDAVVLRGDGSAESVKLSNVSDEGCRIETKREFRIGERLEIAIPSLGQLKAQVRWALPGSAGAMFVPENEA